MPTERFEIDPGIRDRSRSPDMSRGIETSAESMSSGNARAIVCPNKHPVSGITDREAARREEKWCDQPALADRGDSARS